MRDNDLGGSASGDGTVLRTNWEIYPPTMKLKGERNQSEHDHSAEE